MKSLFLLIAIFLSSLMYSQEIIVFGKDEICYLDSKSSPCQPEGDEKIEFLQSFINFNFKDTLQLNQAKLITPPLDWGKKVSDSTGGEFLYYISFSKGFITDIRLYNLLPNHTYLLCLNGNPKLAGNNLFPDTVPNNNIEKYYDFLSVKTDLQGNYHAMIAVYLKHGDYHGRLYVKDKDGFRIVLYHDYFQFLVRQ